jgi:hypothetical protein
MVIFKKVTAKNFFSIGNNPIEIILNKSPTTLVAGSNGSGKCLHHSTKIEICINNSEINQKFLEYLNDKDNDKEK